MLFIRDVRWDLTRRVIYVLLSAIFAVLIAGGFSNGEGLAVDTGAMAASTEDGFMQAYDINVPILAYHKLDISDPTTWYVTVDQFSKQLDVLLAYGYQTVSLDDFLEYRDGTETPPERPVIITFDDGYQDFYDYAFPLLSERGMQATVFVLTGYTGETEEERYSNSWNNPPEPLIYHMIWPELIELSNAEFSIGSHTVSHPNLLDLDLSQAEYEISHSYQDIQAHIGLSSELSFAYPYGSGSDSQTIQSLVQVAGYSSAVSFGGDDGIANPAVSNMWALPRRAILREISLELDNSDPWYFFMRRVDPEFPLPNISFDDFTIYDSAGNERYQYYPGEPLTITIDAYNWGSPTDVLATLEITGSNSNIFNSHFLSPTEDVIVAPFSYNTSPTEFNYHVNLSETTMLGDYSYSFSVFDEYYLLNYYRKIKQAAFSVVESPISIQTNVDNFDLQGNDTFDLWFTIDNTGANAEEMYLTVSLSPGLRVVSTYPESKWIYYSVGSQVKMRGCSDDCPLSTYKISEAYEPEYGMGKRSYRLTLQSLIGSSGEQWVKYRISMRLPEGQLTPDWYLRNPLSGETDQQGWSAWTLPVIVSRNDLFIPFISK